MQPALASDLLIVCGDWDISFVSENLTPEVEVVLTVLGYTNHPDWSVEAGPLGGADIAVYKVDPAPLEEEGVLQRIEGREDTGYADHIVQGVADTCSIEEPTSTDEHIIIEGDKNP